MRNVNFSIAFLALTFLLPQSVSAEEKPKKSLFHYFKKHEVDIFPVPVFETRPDKGNSYGLMPVLLLSDDKNAIKAIFAAIGQYNTVTNFDTAALAYFYPEPEQELLFFGEFAQRYAREASVRFFDPHLGKFYIESDVAYTKTPFGHFFGIGPERAEDDRSNFTSRNFRVDLTGGYYLVDHFRVNLTTRIHTTDLLNRAMTQYDDTLRRYGTLPNVVDSTNWINEISVAFDNRRDREFSKKGSVAEIGFLFSRKELLSDKNFSGFSFEGIHLMNFLSEKMTTALRFHFEQLFGNGIPFYELSTLGGPTELRSFTPLRFVDRGMIVFQIEERIRLFKWKLMGIPFEGYTDPFIELGRVFDSANHLGLDHWQPVGGLGLRLFVPPNVVGRIDFAVGSDGFEIYTALGYPF